MPLDPNIFFQGAALRQANDARTQQLIGGLFDKLEARRMAEQDPERMLRASVARVVQGQGTPEDEKLIKFESILKGGETKYMPDEFGNVRAVSQPTLYDRLYGAGTQPMTVYEQGGQGGGIPPVDMASLEGPTSIMDKIPLPPMGGQYTGDNFEGGEPGIDLQRIADAKARNAAAVLQPASNVSPASSYVSRTPKGQIKSFETDEAIRQKAAEADITASEAGAKKRSELTQESEVNKEQRQQALAEIQGNLQKLLEDAKGTPSGLIEGTAATATSMLGVPNEKALKRARFESGKAISGLQSRISFLKGQGTITDAEAKQAMAFIPEPNDPYEVKIAKLQGGIDYINGAIGQPITPSINNRPGFRYLGTE